jgi:hypothetical protein
MSGRKKATRQTPAAVEVVPRERDGFTTQTIEALKKRAAFICSNPDCRVMSVAPSEADELKALYVGKAAHICAASVGGPRYDSEMTSDQRKHISNGIFLCSNCATMIDNNHGADFTVEQLKEWKSVHEEWIRENLNKSISPQRETPVEIEIVEFQQNNQGNSGIPIQANNIGTINITGQGIGRREDVLSSQQVGESELDSDKNFICTEVEKKFRKKGVIENPIEDYKDATNYLKAKDYKHAAILYIRIYKKANLAFDGDAFAQSVATERSALEETLKELTDVADGMTVIDAEAIFTRVELAGLRLFR